MKRYNAHNATFAALTIALIVSVMTLLLYACRPITQSRPTIVVSIQPQRYVLEQIAGKYYDVVALLQDGANPEQYEPSMNNVMALEQCDAYFMVGHIGFEAAILNRVTANRPDLKVCDTGVGINMINTAHGGTSRDPHVWASVRNARLMAQNMLAALIELDAKHERYYRSRCASLTKHLNELDSTIAAQLDSCSSKAFVVWHPALSYFARDYGLTQISVEDESGNVTPRRIGQVVEEAKNAHAQVFFYQKEFDSRAARSVNEQMRINMVEISPMSYDWESQIIKISTALAGQ